MPADVEFVHGSDVGGRAIQREGRLLPDPRRLRDEG